MTGFTSAIEEVTRAAGVSRAAASRSGPGTWELTRAQVRAAVTGLGYQSDESA